MLLRISSLTALLLALFLTLCPYAYAGFNENLPDSQALSALEIRAQQANPRDGCRGEANGCLPSERCQYERKGVVHGCNDTSLLLGVKKLQLLCQESSYK